MKWKSSMHDEEDSGEITQDGKWVACQAYICPIIPKWSRYLILVTNPENGLITKPYLDQTRTNKHGSPTSTKLFDIFLSPTKTKPVSSFHPNWTKPNGNLWVGTINWNWLKLFAQMGWALGCGQLVNYTRDCKAYSHQALHRGLHEAHAQAVAEVLGGERWHQPRPALRRE